MITNDLPEDLIGTTEAARLLRCHLRTLHRWVRQGKLTGWDRGGRVFLSRAECQGFFRVRAVGSRPQHRAGQLARARRTDRILREAGLEVHAHGGE